ncbi:MAG TPA: CBS domain-containing protein [Actinophytocola sp.]|uniref:CBS domain-containing protein n=1 Tax=Actinophytocola sp. TaxID=1872138 RepID=UPI002DBED564|nr:CBS domain-containing protein [Actinophytocola sp.]HEU5471657.1 CBS domain-containing protein [Actinophytocola sp.]
MREPTVASVMTSPAITVGPDSAFKDVVALLAGKKISAVPVVDESGHPLGVVSEADVMAKQEFHGGNDTTPWWSRPRRRTRRHKALGVTAAEVMTTPAITIGAEEPVTRAARHLADKRVRRLVVIDPDGVVIGVVARHDVLGMFLREDPAIQDDIEELVLRKGMWVIPGTVTVAVADGVATLEGTLEHRSAVQVAEHLTSAVPGVVGVHNNLRYTVDDTTAAGL